MKTREELDAAMNEVNKGWRYRWCKAEVCGCMGCANRVGGLAAKGFTEEQWREWVRDNPAPTEPHTPYITRYQR